MSYWVSTKLDCSICYFIFFFATIYNNWISSRCNGNPCLYLFHAMHRSFVIDMTAKWRTATGKLASEAIQRGVYKPPRLSTRNRLIKDTKHQLAYKYEHQQPPNSACKFDKNNWFASALLPLPRPSLSTHQKLCHKMRWLENFWISKAHIQSYSATSIVEPTTKQIQWRLGVKQH